MAFAHLSEYFTDHLYDEGKLSMKLLQYDFDGNTRVTSLFFNFIIACEVSDPATIFATLSTVGPCEDASPPLNCSASIAKT